MERNHEDRRQPLHTLTVMEAAELLGLHDLLDRVDWANNQIEQLAKGLEHIHRMLHEMKETQMTTKDEVLAELADAKTLAEENQKDTQRLVAATSDISAKLKDVQAQLEAAVANNDLSAVSDSVAQINQIVQATDDAVEAASPEPPAEPQP